MLDYAEDKYAFVAALLLVLGVSTTLNGLVIVIFKWNRLIRTVNNSLVLNLAVSDCLFVGLSSATSVVSILYDATWFQDPIPCRIVGYCIHLFQSASSNVSALISLHRFVSIVMPSRKFFGHPSCSSRVTVALWSYTVVSLLPSAVRQDAYRLNHILATCTHFRHPAADAIFVTYATGVNFVLPFSLMLFFYGRIYKTVLRHRMSVANEITNTEAIERKSKRLMVAVLGIFAVTWAPYSVVLLYSAFVDRIPSNSVVYAVWLLNLSSTIFHPIAYAVCNRMYLRCIIRFLRCRGPISSASMRPPTVPCVSPISQRSCFVATSKIEEEEEEEEEDEISIIAPLPGYSCQFCEHCGYGAGGIYGPTFISDETQTSDMSVEQRDGSEKIVRYSSHPRPIQNQKVSSCSRCSVGTYSTRSSVPTVMRFPFRRFHRSASNSSHASHFVCGPTPIDSGRSSFATPGPCSARTSFASRYLSTPNSARTSTASQFLHHSTSDSTTSSSFTDKSAPRQDPGSRRSIRRIGSESSHHSFASSYSALRSVRSSMSSRISHYLRMSNSTRSSLTSQCTSTFLPTPFSTRPNSPNAELEFFYMSGCSPRSTRQGSLFSTRSSSELESRFSSRISCLQIPESSLDIYEDIEPLPSDDESVATSGNNSPRVSPCQSPHCNCDKMKSSSSSTCHRVSVYMLGDFEMEDSTGGMEAQSTEGTQSGRNYWHGVNRTPLLPGARAKKFQKPRSGPSTPSPKQLSPHPFDEESAPHKHPGGLRSPVEELYERSKQQSAIDSINKAVGVVLSAKRLTARARSTVFPYKPDTPVPELQPTIQIHRIPVKEPIRFIYEGPIPNNYYTYGTQKPMMSHLRVPGRPPNVPQTIVEEDPIPPSPTELTRPETPSPRRRKNASSWIAPPIIDVMEVDDHKSKDMRVECPGVLVEHHS